jgi:hypothetical protein
VPGLLYLLMGLPGVVSLQYLPATFIVRGDAAATARRITEGAQAYRLCILSDVVSCIGFILVALALYNVFQHVDRRYARAMVAFVAMSAAIGIVNDLNLIAPLILLGGTEYSSAFSQPQLEALAMGFLSLRGSGNALNAMLWGLWLFPFGVLVIRSGFLPKALGICLIIGCFAYVATSVAGIALPAYRKIVAIAMVPLYAVGELPIALWLIFKGVRAPLRSTAESA